MTWEPPKEFEEYRIIRQVGAGAMGVVYLGHDTLLDRPVAIKFISELEIGTAARDRFFVEARAVARLSHPNVVAVYRVGEVKQRPYLVSEYVRGASLAALAKPISWERVVKVGIGLARGLGAAHRRGVLHRDIKPANVVLSEEDEAKLLDFGLAKLATTAAVQRTESDDAPSAAPRPGVALPDQDVDATVSIAAPAGRSRRGTRPDPAHVVAAAGPLTQDGGLVGTPLYLAPELWQGVPASPASDVYSLGVVLYELLAGAPPHAGFTIAELGARVPAVDSLPISSHVTNVPTRLAEVIDACVSRDPARRPGSADMLGDLLEAVVGGAPPTPEGSPYRGLSTFESEHRAVFFGRAAETRSVVERLRTETLVIIAGDSGAGKSSLCRAAVLPAVAEKSFAGKRWRIAAMVPGARPLSSLEAALSHRPADEGLLLFIDQLEELVTIADPTEAAAAAERIAELVVATSNVRVLASARSDFLGRLASLPSLGELVGRALFLLGPLGDRGLREAILGPARALGYAFEDADTIDELVVSGRRHLPLLQFALAELWDARDPARRVIPAQALEQIGGVTAALARHADSVLAGMPAAERAAARAIFLALVTAEGTRVRRTHSELITGLPQHLPRAREALEALVRGRLLVAQEAELGSESAYTIAHEALLQGWDTLRSWIGRDAERRAVLQRIERAAADWERLGRPKVALLNERLLQEAVQVDTALLPPHHAAFLRASRSAAARRRRSRWAVILGLPVVAVGVVLGTQLKQSRDRDAVVGAARQMLSDARQDRSRLEGLRRDAFAAFDGRGASTGERLWRDALALEPAVEQAYATAGERVERLLQDAPERSDARSLLSDILLERAQLADEEHRGLERDELVRRLGMYGSAERWDMPARLSIATEPPGAAVTIQRYELSGGRWILSPPVSLGAAPLSDRAVVSGSVVLQLAHDGAEPVLLAAVLPRGGAEHVVVRLPARGSIPQGFAYIPAGRFLYGTSGGEEPRAFYESQPIHPVETGAYLIARNETTFGEWLEFLRALPREARARRTPKVSRQGFTVVLSESSDGRYRLTLGPDDHPYTAQEGVPLQYPGRTTRRSVDWSRLPVTGVSYLDALAYMAWLRDTGRVPNARPCNEHEWERAARGADGRAFPHGESLAPDDANHDVTYGRRPDAFGPDEVGSHPASDNAYGVHDLTGNVWEWTAWIDDPAIPVARGGSFFQTAAVARPENRSRDVPDRPDAYYGVRVCADPVAELRTPGAP